MKTNLKEINQTLKDLGYGFVKISTGDWGQTKTYKDWNGNTTKGIIASSFGPMTVTNAYKERADKVLRDIRERLLPISDDVQYLQDGGLRVIFDLGAKFRTIDFTLQSFPAYAGSLGYDEGYKNLYWVTSIMDKRK